MNEGARAAYEPRTVERDEDQPMSSVAEVVLARQMIYLGMDIHKESVSTAASSNISPERLGPQARLARLTYSLLFTTRHSLCRSGPQDERLR